MRVMIVYDSSYGNTQAIANSIEKRLSENNEVRVFKAGQADMAYLAETPVLIVGSPTHGGKPTPEIQEFLGNIVKQDLVDTFVAAFDTRIDARKVGRGLRFLMKTIGYAAEKMEKKLSDLGGEVAVPCEGFIVEANEGPLREGEPERAVEWADSIMQYVETVKPQSAMR